MDPSQFYTGLVVDLYEPLLSRRARAEDFAPFLERFGMPALELACGSGIPLLDLLERGFEVEGLDSSEEMLARCRDKARARGLAPTLYRQEMQRMSLPRRYRSIYVAAGTFNLLVTDADAREALARIRAHLLPGGCALLPLEVPDFERATRGIGRFREARTQAGAVIRVGATEMEVDHGARTLRTRLRYERETPGTALERLDRDFLFHWWEADDFRVMLADAGFERSELRGDVWWAFG